MACWSVCPNWNTFPWDWDQSMGFFLMIIFAQLKHVGVLVCNVCFIKNTKWRKGYVFTLVFHTGVSPDSEFGLSSLELLNCYDPCLSPVAFDALSSLTKLTVHYKQWCEDPTRCRLTKWLQGLHVLSELNISCKYEIMHKHGLYIFHFHLADSIENGLQPEVTNEKNTIFVQ